ncbi:MAG: redox-regulated ATPase YchF [Defluviitaleaceae bacterium]|nr:redox-regulated ATPase YchF [Defluviitaleaceae bacterium]MCL2264261.1 redox-regulated ATPase YchF [Defluviitaleaceae bacterium]
MKLGIVGLPNAGKSTLWSAMMQKAAEASNYPFCTIDPNVGRVPVPDERLGKLNEIYNAKSVVPAAVEMVDIAGLVKGASQGEGMGNQFLSHIREVDAIVHVVRCFDDENVVHVQATVDPMRDVETINLELIFADLEMLERRLEKVAKTARTDKSFKREEEILTSIKAALEDGKPARSLTWEDADDLKLVESFTLITQKPMLYAANISESDIENGEENNAAVKALSEFAKSEGSRLFVSCAKLESEIATLEPEEKEMFLADLGIAESGLDRLISAGYEILGLISFLTAGPKEVRAWTVRRNSKAPQAAGKIHSDLERGFIRAEVVAYEDLIAAGTYAAAKEKGQVRIEGKEYIVKDGDVLLIRFNV